MKTELLNQSKFSTTLKAKLSNMMIVYTFNKNYQLNNHTFAMSCKNISLKKQNKKLTLSPNSKICSMYVFILYLIPKGILRNLLQ